MKLSLLLHIFCILYKMYHLTLIYILFTDTPCLLNFFMQIKTKTAKILILSRVKFSRNPYRRSFKSRNLKQNNYMFIYFKLKMCVSQIL